jgi:hypothetical protein
MSLTVSPNSSSQGWSSVISRSGLSAAPAETSSLAALEIEPVRGRHGVKLFGGFGQGNVQARLVLGLTSQEELESERRLARTRGALDHVEPVRDQPAAQNVIETLDPGRQAGRCL